MKTKPASSSAGASAPALETPEQLEAKARAEAQAIADAQAAEKAEAQARADAEAQARIDAEAQARAEAEAIAAAQAQAAADAEAAAKAAEDEARANAEQQVADPFPCQVTVRNNSHIALSDPVSGAHVQAGGSAMFWLHDADHYQRVMANFAELLEHNRLPQEVLSFEGLPE